MAMLVYQRVNGSLMGKPIVSAPQFSPCQGSDEYLITSGQVQRGQGADPELEEKIHRKPLEICYIAIEDVPFIDGLPIRNGDFL